ncbi:hypothetical protein Tco_1449119 [Tanacetum coccineum]
MITNPDNPDNQIPEPIAKMTEANKKQNVTDVKVMNYLLQAIPNDIYNSVDACKDAQKMWEQIIRLMYGSESSQSHVSPSYSHSPQKYYVTHPSSLVDYEEDYQGKLQKDALEDKLTTAMMLLARAITQKFSTPTNNRLRISSNTRNQAVIHDGKVDIQTKNVGYGRNGKRNAGRQNKNQAANAGNGHVQQIDESNQIVQRVPQTESNLGRARKAAVAMKDEMEATQ